MGECDLSKLYIDAIVYTTRRSPFANTANYRKGKITRIEFDDKNNIKMIWCYFGKKYGHEAFEPMDIDVCLFYDKGFIEREGL